MTSRTCGELFAEEGQEDEGSGVPAGLEEEVILPDKQGTLAEKVNLASLAAHLTEIEMLFLWAVLVDIVVR